MKTQLFIAFFVTLGCLVASQETPRAVITDLVGESSFYQKRIGVEILKYSQIKDEEIETNYLPLEKNDKTIMVRLGLKHESTSPKARFQVIFRSQSDQPGNYSLPLRGNLGVTNLSPSKRPSIFPFSVDLTQTRPDSTFLDTLPRSILMNVTNGWWDQSRDALNYVINFNY